jgi:hypothetical protein
VPWVVTGAVQAGQCGGRSRFSVTRAIVPNMLSS